jgi:hypothetical protein
VRGSPTAVHKAACPAAWRNPRWCATGSMRGPQFAGDCNRIFRIPSLNPTAMGTGADARFGIEINGTAVGDFHVTISDSASGSTSTCTSSLVARCGAQLGGPLIIGTVTVTVNSPVNMFMSLEVSSGSNGPSTSAMSDFSQSLDFLISSNLFNQLAGATVNEALFLE